MRIPRFYTTQALACGNSVALEAGPSQHIARALRMQAGAELLLFNGRGGQYPAVLYRAGKKQVSVHGGRAAAGGAGVAPGDHLGIAVSRGERMDWVIQKATELGVSSVTPLFTERTEVKLRGERADKKTRHWQKIAISACEQCGRNRLPDIAGLSELSAWLGNTDGRSQAGITPSGWPVDSSATPPASIALLIGPEGGLSEAEVDAAELAGYQSLRLGPRVLRTETAPLAALAILQAKWGDMAGLAGHAAPCSSSHWAWLHSRKCPTACTV